MFSHSHIQGLRQFMRREGHHISPRPASRDTWLLLLGSLIREVIGPYLQQLDEYFLHSRWKGSRHPLQISECYLHTSWKGPRILQQQRQYERSSSPWLRTRELAIHIMISLTLMLAPSLEICMRSSDRERRKTACYNKSSTWPNGQ